MGLVKRVSVLSVRLSLMVCLLTLIPFYALVCQLSSIIYNYFPITLKLNLPLLLVVLKPLAGGGVVIFVNLPNVAVKAQDVTGNGKAT